MRPGRHTTAEAQSVSVAADVCLPQHGCFEAPVTDDYAEQYSERTSEYINDMVGMAETWGMAMLEMPQAIAERRQFESAREEWSDGVGDRSERRHMDRFKDTHAINIVAWTHNAGRWAARPELPDGAPKLAAINDPVELARRIADIGDVLNSDEGEDDKLAQQFKLLFVAEQVVHAQMAMIELTDPQAFRDLFNPNAITELPPALQQLAALDISHDKESIILRNSRREWEDNRTTGQQLADYLSENHLPDNLRQIAMGISLGAKAMGAPACPLNDAGLCTKVLERIPLEELPEAIRRDMEIRAGKAAQGRTQRLVQFGRSNMPARIFDGAVVYDLPSAEETTLSKKRRQTNNGHHTKADKRDLQLEALHESQELSFSTVSVRIHTEGGEPVVYEVGGENSFEELFETKLFKDYFASHRGSNLTDMLGSALEQILFSPSYAQSGGSIVPLVDRTLKTSQNQSGVTERLMRFSGQKSTRLGSGKIGRQTRIIFSQGTKDGVRHVTIRQIAHKSDLEKGIRI